MDDELLVERILAGDDEALQLLYERYFQPLFQYAYVQTGDYHHAEEVTQDIFCKMARNLAKFEGKSSFRTWLFAIGRHAVIDFQRKRKQDIPMEKEKVEYFREQYHSANKQVSESPFADQVMSYLKKLPNDYRQVIYLRFVKGFSIADTAEVMSKTTIAVKSLQHRARNRLLQLIQSEVNER